MKEQCNQNCVKDRMSLMINGTDINTILSKVGAIVCRLVLNSYFSAVHARKIGQMSWYQNPRCFFAIDNRPACTSSFTSIDGSLGNGSLDGSLVNGCCVGCSWISVFCNFYMGKG